MCKSKGLVLALAICTLSIFATASAQTASAGTLFSGVTCNLGTQHDCYGGGVGWTCGSGANTPQTAYVRFGQVTQASWYPSHYAEIGYFQNGGFPIYAGSRTSSRFAYSPISPPTCYWDMRGHEVTNTTNSRTYNLQVFLGSY